jgi:pimeloyl-ACP methyl ester carboxylesterase
MKKTLVFLAMLAVAMIQAVNAASDDATFLETVKHGYADSNGVKIHYAELGKGPLVVMIHGFPDFWYTWRHQMQALADNYRVVAIDQRGYNKSDAPMHVEDYAFPALLGDVSAVIRHFGEDKAIIVGHDWGASVAWQFAIHMPQMTEKLVILNVPHPNGFLRELAQNPLQQEASSYARKFIAGKPTDSEILFGEPMNPKTLASWVKDTVAQPNYVEAFARSSFTAMLNYYKANYPHKPYKDAWEQAKNKPLPKLQMPVLMFHGLDDWALKAHGLDDTWDWIDKDFTLVTVPGAGHFVQHDAAQLVSTTIKWWLLARPNNLPQLSSPQTNVDISENTK